MKNKELLLTTKEIFKNYSMLLKDCKREFIDEELSNNSKGLSILLAN